MNNYQLKSKDITLDSENKKYHLKIKDLAEEKRPREKLIEHGPEILDTQELLAVLLNTGTKKEEVLNMSGRVLREYGEKTIANQKNARAMEKDLGIPLGKACQIVACFELGRRFFRENKKGTKIIRDAAQAFKYLADMRKLPKEHLRGIYLNSRYQIIHDEVISVGSLTANITHPREVFKPALEYSAVAIILAHNHPSGSTEPTESDIEITKQLIKGAEILGIDFLDHIIIAGNKYRSIMADIKN